MKNEISQRTKISSILAIATLLAGILLLIYMINVEGEPGALPLLLIITGTAWLLIHRYRMKKAGAESIEIDS